MHFGRREKQPGLQKEAQETQGNPKYLKPSTSPSSCSNGSCTCRSRETFLHQINYVILQGRRWYLHVTKLFGVWTCSDLIYDVVLGKDQLIFVTAEDHSTPSTVILPEDDDEYEGLIKPTGEINWDCPCLQGMADGPCGEQFKAAFSCFHYSEAEVKGSDCVPQFRDMQVCFSKYPEVYGKDDDESAEQENCDVKVGHKDDIDSLDKDVPANSQEIQLSTFSENASNDESVSTSQKLES